MKSHLLRLQFLLLFAGFDDLILLELGVEVPPFLSFDPLEVSPFSDRTYRNKTVHDD